MCSGDCYWLLVCSGVLVCSGISMNRRHAHIHVWQKPLKIFFARTGSPMILKLGMQHCGLKLYNLCINGDPGLTLTYFTARLNLCKFFGTWKLKFHENMMMVTLSRWPPCTYVLQPFKNLLLQNHSNDFHETWYVESGTPAHHSC